MFVLQGSKPNGCQKTFPFLARQTKTKASKSKIKGLGVPKPERATASVGKVGVSVLRDIACAIFQKPELSLKD